MLSDGIEIWCANCGVEITWTGFIVQEHHYCCKDCYDGKLCHCGDRMEFEEEYKSQKPAI